MPIEIALLAATVVGKILVPFFQRSAEKVGDALGDKVTDEAAEFATDTANTLWDKIKARFSEPDEQVIADRFKSNADNDKLVALFEDDLQRKLAEDEGFAEEIAALVNAKDPGGSGTVMNIFGKAGIVDARNAHIERSVVTGYAENVHTAPADPGQV
jgi:hypothetical protein